MRIRRSIFSCRIIAACFGALVCCWSLEAHAAGQPTVLKVEPPSWWAAHTINPVRLLVRGANLHGARVTSARAETIPSAVVVNSSGTYLFVSVSISPSARPGDYPLTLETNAGKATIPFSLNPPLDERKNFQGITNDDVIYLIMPDRFSNGDQANDAPAGSPRESNDRANPRAYHGGDLRGVINHLSYLKELGVTSIWLTPWYDNWNGISTCDHPWCPNTSYHGYGAIDYYGVEDHFGEMKDLVELVQKAHALGLKVIQDQVANHVGSHHFWMTDLPLDNWFHGTAAHHVQNPFRADLLLSPHAAESERRPTLDGWFADDLPDLNQEEPEVARYEIQNSLWWVGMTGVDGIREDTIQYMPRFFIRDLLTALHRQYPKMWMVGEVFDRDAAQTSYFMGGRTGWDKIDTELDSDFDFPVWQKSLDAFTGKGTLRAVRETLRLDALYPDPARVTTMINNHDTPRFASLKGATIEGAMMHFALTITVRGTPQVYYGDELYMEGGEDPDNRRDFPGGFRGDRRNAFEPSGRTTAERRMYEWTRDWLRLRRDHAALRRGQMIDLFFDDDAYVYARRHEDETIIIAINRASTPRTLPINADALQAGAGAQLVPLLVAKDRVPLADGKFSPVVPAGSAVAYSLSIRDR